MIHIGSTSGTGRSKTTLSTLAPCRVDRRASWHADAGQMHLYLNYAREHWIVEGENPPVGLILCAEKESTVAHYALEGLPNKVLASEYRTVFSHFSSGSARRPPTRQPMATSRT
jgi:hypothetical protein